MIAATTNGQTTAYTFNALNQLTGVSGPNGTFSYVYDPLGYQISSTVERPDDEQPDRSLRAGQRRRTVQ